MPTPEQIKSLQEDWLKGTRNETTFVHKGKLSITRNNNGEAFSSYFKTSMEMCTARETAQKVINSMTNRRIQVVLEQNDSYTDREKIYLATEHFDNCNLTDGQKFDIFLGFAIHEAGHINNTTFDLEKRYADEGGFQSRFPGKMARIAKVIDNIIEDERTEHITGEAMGGFSDFIGAAKKYAFGKYQNKPIPIQNDKVADFINALLIAVRFTSALDENTITRNYDLLSESKKILTPFPKTESEVARATALITDLLLKNLKNEDKTDNQENPNNIEKQFDSETVRELLDNIENNIINSKNNTIKESTLLKNKDTRNIIKGIAKPVIINDREEPFLMIKMEKNLPVYNKTLTQVSKYIPAIRKALQCHFEENKYVLRGEYKGKIHTNKIPLIRTGQKNIFKAKGSIKCDRISLCLLVDESASMKGKREEAVRQTAILIAEAVKNIPAIELSAYGFSSDKFLVYMEGNPKTRTSLGNISTYGSTPTAEAMNLAGRLIRKRTDKPCILLVLTDGEPNNSESCLKVQKELSNKGFNILGVGIQSATAVNNTFKNKIVIDDLKDLAPTLAKFVNKTVISKTKKQKTMK